MQRLWIAAAIAMAVPVANAAECRATSAQTVTPLIELYTSQGCSSCPPADRWLSTLARQTPAAVSLALHVGYWDYIGWKDPYARREFNDRQARLAALSGSRTVYTPEVFVQGREMRRWHDSALFMQRLRELAERPAEATITLGRIVRDSSGVEVDARAELSTKRATKGARLYVALLENGLSSKVTAGENRGETLANDRVTRAWSGPLALTPQRIVLDAPGAAARDLIIVAFVEDATGVLQSVQLKLRDC